jgi:DNA-binding response OmpR family regulator
VVVIEDNPDISSTVGDWLQQHGHRVRIADTGVDGVALVRDLRPDLVLCDIGLPDITGVEVGQAIRALPLEPQPTLVAVTGWGRDDDRRRTSDAGFDAHLVKPFNLKQLSAILHACMARRSTSATAGE